jgi:ATP-dependent helicase/nuclease subunit B
MIVTDFRVHEQNFIFQSNLAFKSLDLKNQFQLEKSSSSLRGSHRLKLLKLSSACLMQSGSKITLSGEHQNFENVSPIQNIDFSEKQNNPILIFNRNKNYFQPKKNSYGISELATYLDCPYKYYARYQHKISLKKEDEFKPAGDKKGNVIHSILYRLIHENRSDYLNALEFDSYKARVDEHISKILDEEFLKENAFQKHPEIVIRSLKEQIQSTLSQMVKNESFLFKNKLKNTIPHKLEWAFSDKCGNAYPLNVEGESFFLNGRIDRIDIHNTTNNYTIIDYKTGSTPSSTELLEGKSIQLILYHLAVKKFLFPEKNPSALLFYTLNENKYTGLCLENSADENALNLKRKSLSIITPEILDESENHTLAHVGAAIKGIHGGKFDPNPQSKSACQYCEFKNTCGYHFK